jgi:hypothetical protein
MFHPAAAAAAATTTTTGKIIIQCILIFIFSESKLEDN